MNTVTEDVWVAVDKDGMEFIFYVKPPQRGVYHWWAKEKFSQLSDGYIEKTISKPMLWEDEPVKIIFVGDVYNTHRVYGEYINI